MNTYEIRYTISDIREPIFRECLSENKVAYGRTDLLDKLGWFWANAIKVTGIDRRDPNSTYTDVTYAYKHRI